VEKRNAYQINYLSLPLGKHEFEFIINDSFFESFEYGEIRKGNVKVRVLFEKKIKMSILDFNLDGFVNVECDRCLDEIAIPVKGEFRLVAKESTESTEQDNENEDLIVLPPNEHFIELKNHIHEFIHLLLPMHRECADTPKGKCNEETETFLKKINIKNSDGSETDPRWDALKNIKLNNNN
jgi:uncharacterized metal-binding protein YceD (DUF177 family)